MTRLRQSLQKRFSLSAETQHGSRFMNNIEVSAAGHGHRPPLGQDALPRAPVHQGEIIPSTARIFAILDIWDALTRDHPSLPVVFLHDFRGCIEFGSGSSKLGYTFV